MDPSEIEEIRRENPVGTTDFEWASVMNRDAFGRLTGTRLADSGGSQSVTITWREDGTPDTWQVTRGNGPATDVVDRTYHYWDDGMTAGWSSGASVDAPRTFFYDGGNRIVCGA